MDLDTWVSLAALLGALVTFHTLTSRQIGSLRGEIRDVRDKLHSVRDELRTDINSVRTELRADIKTLDDRVYALAVGLHLPTGPTEAATEALAAPTGPPRPASPKRRTS